MKKLLIRSSAMTTSMWVTATIFAQRAFAQSNFTIEPPNQIQDVRAIVRGIIQLIFLVAGIIAFLFLLLGGIKWITAGGDKGKVEEARNQIVQALIGLLIVVAAFALMLFFQEVTGICVGFGTCTLELPVFTGS